MIAAFTWIEHAQLVRYDRSGKWYIEPSDGSRRSPVTIDVAVDTAMRWWTEGGTPVMDVPGGKRFDRMVRTCCAALGEATS